MNNDEWNATWDAVNDDYTGEQIVDICDICQQPLNGETYKKKVFIEPYWLLENGVYRKVQRFKWWDVCAECKLIPNNVIRNN